MFSCFCIMQSQMEMRKLLFSSILYTTIIYIYIYIIYLISVYCCWPDKYFVQLIECAVIAEFSILPSKNIVLHFSFSNVWPFTRTTNPEFRIFQFHQMNFPISSEMSYHTHWRVFYICKSTNISHSRVLLDEKYYFQAFRRHKIPKFSRGCAIAGPTIIFQDLELNTVLYHASL